MNEDQIVTNEDFKEYIEAVSQTLERFSEIIVQQNNSIKILENKLTTLERVVGNVALK